MTLGQDLDKYLDKENEDCCQRGFVGMCLDDEAVSMLEKNLEEQNPQNPKLDIFYLLAVDLEGHSTLIVPGNRADAKTCTTEADAYRDVGNLRVEEVEQIVITRYEHQSPRQHVVKKSQPLGPGQPCLIQRSHRVRSSS